jgi:hypothetical protein
MVNKSVSIISGSLFQLLMESQILRNKIWVTNEGRDLNVYFISTPENLANLDLIRNNNLAALVCLIKNRKIGDKLVWLSFNVHGNEFARTESAMTVMSW